MASRLMAPATFASAAETPPLLGSGELPATVQPPEKPLAVLHLVRSLEVGGLERLVVDLTCARGIEQTQVACLRAPGAFAERLQQVGGRVTSHAGRDSRLARLRWLSGVLRTHRPDVLHCHGLYAFLHAGLLSLTHRMPALVLTKHGREIPATPLIRWLLPWLLRRSAVIGVSQDVLNQLQQRFGRNLKHAHYIPNGIDLARISANACRQSMRNALEIPNQALVLGSVGRLSPEKGYDVLLQALKQLRFPAGRLQVVIAGDGPCQSDLKQQIERDDLTQQVHMLGERHDIPQLLAAFDGFVLPSHSEGQPLSVIEAMASGLGIIATNVGGMPSLVENHVNGRLVAANDPSALAAVIADCVQHPERIGAYGRQSRLKAQHSFGMAPVVSAYEQVYRTLASRTP